MTHQKKTVSFLTLLSLVILGTAATIGSEEKYKNLQVLPKDIGEKQLDSIMETYNKALKVSCDFCHIAPKDFLGLYPANPQLDFALDNEMKENARKMIRLTIDINRNYFYTDHTVKPEYMNVVSCNTCHRGNPFPANE